MSLSEDDLEPIGADTGIDELTPDDARNDEFVEQNLRRNFLAHFAHGMLGMTGFRLIYAPTFVPTYIYMLTGSSVMVGLSQALQQTGAIMSPLLSASRIEDKKRVMPFAIRAGTMMRVQLLGLALAGWFLSGPWLIGATMLFLFLLGYYTGAQRVVFQLLMAKVIPLKKRGRLQGYRNLAGGGIAAALSWWAGSTLIENNVLGNGYATTFMLSFVLTSLGLTALTVIMREPDNHRRKPPLPFMERLRQLPELLKDSNYKYFLIAQLLTTCGRIGMPFCILHAGSIMQLDGKALGALSLAFLGADTVSNLLWGSLGDRRGFRLVYLLSTGLWIAAFAMMLVAHDRTAFLIAFIAMGAGVCGYMLSAQTLVLEFGNREDIPMRLAISTTAETSVASIGPLAGGVIAAVFGFAPLIIVSMVLMSIAWLAMLVLVRDPRNSNMR